MQYQKGILNDQQRKFVEVYVATGLPGKAAREAGYTEMYAANDLLRNPVVCAAIAEGNVDRKVHLEQTYRNLIATANAALRVMKETLENPASELAEKEMSIEGARRTLETLAKAEGLMTRVETINAADDGRQAISLQEIVQLINQRRAIPKLLEMKVEQLPAAAPPPTNGNGNGNGKNIPP